jgi:hypothetical protein
MLDRYNRTAMGSPSKVSSVSDLLHGYANQDYNFGVSGTGASWSLNPQADLIGRFGYAKFDAGVLDEDGLHCRQAFAADWPTA